MHDWVLLVLVITFALSFDFVNGFHDCANAIATTVSTRALKPHQAIVLARTLNFVGAMCGTAVAYTIGKGVIDLVPTKDNLPTVLAALAGAIAWNLFTWLYGLPSSSTHALVGGLLGAGIVAQGTKIVVWTGIRKILLGMVLSPIVGFVFGLLFITAIYWIFRFATKRINRTFRVLQIASASWMAWSHGLNDAQNAMGIITIALLCYGHLDSFSVPVWVKLACALAMGLGTGYGGWRIMKTMGFKVAKLEPVHGFAAETGAGLIITIMSYFGIPISTTHAISSSIMGVGAARKMSAVRWDIVGNIVGAWIFTVPGAAMIAAPCCWILHLIF